MTLSYSLGLTTGSAVAYLLDASLGPHPGLDNCHGYKQHVNSTVIIGYMRGVTNA